MLLSAPNLEFAFAPETLYEKSWTGIVLFSMGCSKSSVSFYKKLGLRLAHIYAKRKPKFL